MTSTTLGTVADRRLGTYIIRNLAISLLATKHDLCVGYASKEPTDQLGIELFSGRTVHADTSELHDGNYLSFYNRAGLRCNLIANHSSFQTKEVAGLIHRHVRTSAVQASVIRHNPHKGRYHANNDLFVHVKLTDVCHHHPVPRYYQRTIETIAYDQLYVCSDDASHPMVGGLADAYPNARWVECGRVETIQLASTCRHVVLSHGSFSAVIGYLAFFSTVYCPDYDLDTMWHGDMFSIPGWVKVPCRPPSIEGAPDEITRRVVDTTG